MPSGKVVTAGGRSDSVAKFQQLTEACKAYNGQLDLVMQQLRAGDFNSARAGLIVTLPAAQAAYFDNLDEFALDGPEVGRRRRGRGLRPLCACPQPADRPGGRRRRDRCPAGPGHHPLGDAPGRPGSGRRRGPRPGPPRAMPSPCAPRTRWAACSARWNVPSASLACWCAASSRPPARSTRRRARFPAAIPTSPSGPSSRRPRSRRPPPRWRN